MQKNVRILKFIVYVKRIQLIQVSYKSRISITTLKVYLKNASK